MVNHKQKKQDSNPIFDEWESILNSFIDGKTSLTIEFFVSSFEVYTEYRQQSDTLITALKLFLDSSKNGLDNLICSLIMINLNDDCSAEISNSITSLFQNHISPFMDKDISHLNQTLDYLDELNLPSPYDSISLREKLSVIPFSIEDKQSRVISSKILLLSKIINLSNSSSVKTISKPKKPLEQNLFINKGEVWEISFKGEPITLPSTLGLKYIHESLLNSGKELSCFELEESIISNPDQNANDNIIASLKPDRFNKSEIKIRDTSNVDLLAYDKKAEIETKERIEKLKDLISKYDRMLIEAEGSEDEIYIKNIEEQKDKAEEELIKLDNYINSGKSKYGKTRKLGDKKEQSRGRVFKAIATAKNNIREKTPALEKHLEKQLKTGYMCVYNPIESVEWTLY
jgi:hypothetical protein